MRPLLVLLMFLVIAFAGCFGGDDDGDGGDGSDTGTGDGDDGPTDSDGDGVPDDEDVCDGHDDNVDSDGDGTPDGCDDTPQGEDEDPGPKRGAVTWDVMVRDNSFSPSDLTIQAGDSVRFVYDGSNPHTATADNGEFHSGDCPGTDCFSDPVGRDEYTWESAAENIGDVPYYCDIHGGPGGSGMSGSITVLERYDSTPS